MLILADAVNVAQHALKRGQQAEHNVENSLSLPRKVLHTNRFRLNGHFYIVLPATLYGRSPAILSADLGYTTLQPPVMGIRPHRGIIEHKELNETTSQMLDHRPPRTART